MVKLVGSLQNASQLELFFASFSLVIHLRTILKSFLLCQYNSLTRMGKSLQEDNDLRVPQRGQQYETEMRSPYTELHNHDFRITEVLNHVRPLSLVLLQMFIALQYDKLCHKPEICGKRRKFKQLSGISLILQILLFPTFNLCEQCVTTLWG